jgi:hypothetical protein
MGLKMLDNPRSMFLALILTTTLVSPVADIRAQVSHPAAPAARDASHQQARTMKIRITVEDKTLIAVLEDNPTSRDFVSLLPLTLTLKDYAATEKISDLPRRLSKEGAPAGSDPSIGAITYYSPWGNLAIFYRDAGYASGLIKLGTIESGIEALNRPGSFEVTIDLVGK